MSGGKWVKKLVLLSGGLVVTTKMYQYVRKHQPFKKLTAERAVREARPTLLVHGTNGTRRSLGGMIERWDKQGLAYKALDVEVAKDGTLTITGNWQEPKHQKHPLIQVIFKEGDPPEWQQGDWLKKVLSQLTQQFGITDINFLGHSMGGVAALRYLVDHSADQHLPKVKRLVVIGAPFNGEVVAASGVTKYDLGKHGPHHFAETFRYFNAYQQHLPDDLEVLNIYGDLRNGSRSDGFVAVDSARSLRFLIKDKIACYREKEVIGVKAQHSLLHENNQVDRLSAHFLWSR